MATGVIAFIYFITFSPQRYFYYSVLSQDGLG